MRHRQRLPTWDQVVEAESDGKRLSDVEQFVMDAHTGDPEDIMRFVEGLLERLEEAEAGRPVQVAPRQVPKRRVPPGDVELRPVVVDRLRASEGWRTAAHIRDELIADVDALAAHGLTAEITSTSVSIALQRAFKRGDVSRAPEPGRPRRAVWNADASATPPEGSVCPYCKRSMVVEHDCEVAA